MQFKKKPVVIEAVRYETEADFNLVRLLVGDSLPIHRLGDGKLGITTLEGVMTANPGDWIIKGVKGECYPCKPDIFALTYERAYPAESVKPYVAPMLRVCEECKAGFPSPGPFAHNEGCSEMAAAASRH